MPETSKTTRARGILPQEVITLLGASLVGVLSYFGAKIFHQVAPLIQQHVVPAISNGTLLSLCLMLALLLFLALGYLFYLHLTDHPAIIRHRYAFNERTGISEAKKGGTMVCTRCLLQGLEAPLGKVNEQHKRVCLACGLGYSEIEHV